MENLSNCFSFSFRQYSLLFRSRTPVSNANGQRTDVAARIAFGFRWKDFSNRCQPHESGWKDFLLEATTPKVSGDKPPAATRGLECNARALPAEGILLASCGIKGLGS
jgi:hypothetical protein